LKTKLVLFDFDLTLVDASACLFGALRSGLNTVGISIGDDMPLKPLIGLSLEEQFRLLSGAEQYDPAVFTRFKTAYVYARNAGEAEGSHLIPGVAEGLQTLQAKGLVLGIVSTGAGDRIRRTLSRFGILAYFGNRIFGGAADKTKVIEDALSDLNFSVEQAIYVGDRPEDGQASNKANVSFVAITTGSFAAEQFPHGTPVIASLTELLEVLESSA
jgi:phosphoglycolate phosphatase